jgi:hypothetical protein
VISSSPPRKYGAYSVSYCKWPSALWIHTPSPKLSFLIPPVSGIQNRSHKLLPSVYSTLLTERLITAALRASARKPPFVWCDVTCISDWQGKKWSYLDVLTLMSNRNPSQTKKGNTCPGLLAPWHWPSVSYCYWILRSWQKCAGRTATPVFKHLYFWNLRAQYYSAIRISTSYKVRVADESPKHALNACDI